MVQNMVINLSLKKWFQKCFPKFVLKTCPLNCFLFLLTWSQKSESPKFVIKFVHGVDSKIGCKTGVKKWC